jgi:hypothetical protein
VLVQACLWGGGGAVWSETMGSLYPMPAEQPALDLSTNLNWRNGWCTASLRDVFLNSNQICGITS